MRTFTVFSVLLVLVVCGCSSMPRSKDKELEQVAKDWSMTIRASQIIPVYPLTEDLQPGDVFLVQVPIDEQQRIYKDKGFLPLDNLIDRIHPSQFCRFYDKSFMKECQTLPSTWLMPGDKNAWGEAPGTSFPTYTFSARKGAGFNLALPIQGVPVGLSLMGGDAAQGSVTIAEAKTYGVDTISLYDDLQKWYLQEGHSAFVANFAATDKKRNYLRVITRVYLTGNLTVSLQSARSASGGLSAGAGKPVDIFVNEPSEKVTEVTAEAYKKNLELLNGTIADGISKIVEKGAAALPGGSVRVVAASANSVTLREDFVRPLVIGYLGFDVAIDENGALGAPIPTHSVLTQKDAIPPAAVERLQQKRIAVQRIVAAVTDKQSGKLSLSQMKTAFDGTAFSDLSAKFDGQSPTALEGELSRAKYRTSIEQFEKNLAK